MRFHVHPAYASESRQVLVQEAFGCSGQIIVVA
jgi:hypothetical protein